MAKALPIEHYRETYRSHMTRAGLFGVPSAEFNDRVRARLAGGYKPTPQQWSSAAYLTVQAIAGRKCCPKASGRPCMCEDSFTCPDHGVTCFGSHD
jgi:hypothetical protein